MEDRDHTIQCFERHIAEVKQIVPQERLLVYEVPEGWQPLCDFLNVPVPTDKPFPNKNSTGKGFKKVRQLILEGKE